MPDPILVSTWRFGLPANAAGFPHLLNPGGLLDALEQTCVACELDESVDSVGVGGLPDASGQVSLDGAIMLSPARCAGVGYVRRYPHPVSIARRVMEKTPHKLLVGAGAEAFAEQEGFAPRELLTPAARERWEQWKAEPASPDATETAPATPRGATVERAAAAADAPIAEGGHDTLGVLGLDVSGALGVACTTSGRAFKLPGRVGDSPLIGPGLYCDPLIGAAVATGTGELMIGTCACFLVVERMRAGDRAIDAIRHVLARVADAYPLRPKDQCALIALGPDGHYASGALRPGFTVSVTTRSASDRLPPDVVLLT